jgi:epoxyqueuosine reductase
MNAERIRGKARELGFTHVGIAPATPLDEEEARLREWIGRGYAASMEWIGRAAEKRGDPRLVLPGARSVIAVALNYYTDHPHADRPGTGKISRYAWGDDYHDILTQRLSLLWEWILGECPGAEGRMYSDTGPVMEKAWAQRAGIGWLGKHANVITADLGSWVFLGELITTLDLEHDMSATDHCGTCTLCIQACPTDAIVEPYVVDSARCLSYLTIEHRGEIAGDLCSRFEGWIYGCDICQDVCPWNHKFSTESPEPGFQPRAHTLAPDLVAWSEMSSAEFTELFRGSPVKRAKREGLVRNVRIALAGDEGKTSDPFGTPDASNR